MDREQALKAHAERTRAEIDRANNPHEFYVKVVPGGGGYFIIVNERGNDIGAPLYLTFDDASDAIGEMIADDNEDKRLNRHRHESPPDEPPAGRRYGASYGANSGGRT